MDPIVLDAVDFWKLRARAEEAVRAQQDALLTPQALEAARARQRAVETLDALATKYGFDASGEMRFDEETLSIVPMDPQTPLKA